jgi:hypothetical protein
MIAFRLELVRTSDQFQKAPSMLTLRQATFQALGFEDWPESKAAYVRLMYFGVGTNIPLAAKSFCCGAKGGIQLPTPAFFRLFRVGAFSPLL